MEVFGLITKNEIKKGRLERKLTFKKMDLEMKALGIRVSASRLSEAENLGEISEKTSKRVREFFDKYQPVIAIDSSMDTSRLESRVEVVKSDNNSKDNIFSSPKRLQPNSSLPTDSSVQALCSLGKIFKYNSVEVTTSKQYAVFSGLPTKVVNEKIKIALSADKLNKDWFFVLDASEAQGFNYENHANFNRQELVHGLILMTLNGVHAASTCFTDENSKDLRDDTIEAGATVLHIDKDTLNKQLMNKVTELELKLEEEIQNRRYLEERIMISQDGSISPSDTPPSGYLTQEDIRTNYYMHTAVHCFIAYLHAVGHRIEPWLKKRPLGASPILRYSFSKIGMRERAMAFLKELEYEKTTDKCMKFRYKGEFDLNVGEAPSTKGRGIHIYFIPSAGNHDYAYQTRLAASGFVSWFLAANPNKYSRVGESFTLIPLNGNALPTLNFDKECSINI
jgi:hypothetical protein